MVASSAISSVSRIASPISSGCGSTPTYVVCFNSGTGIVRTFNDVVLAVCTALGRPLRIRYIDMPAALRCQYQNFTQADMSKLYRAGFTQPPTSLEAGVQQFLAPYGVRLPHP